MTQATCPYFGTCGGCNCQHIPYELQLENKQKLVARSVGVQPESVKKFFGEPFHYRNRMDFIFHQNGLGFRQAKNWKQIVDIEHCPISDEKINQILTQLRKHFAHPDYFDIYKKTGTFRFVIIRTTSLSKTIIFTLNRDSSHIDEAHKQIESFAKTSDVQNVLVTYIGKDEAITMSDEAHVVKGSEFLQEIIANRTISFSALAFFQNNSKMADSMVRYVSELVEPNHTVLDLYGGVGTFGIGIAHKAKNTVIVEISAQAVKAAKENIEANKVNAQAHAMNASSFGKLSYPQPLTIITDPPRSGMDEKTIRQIIQLKPKKIIYISCNPIQLEKELFKFKEYELKSTAMFDLFPQTNHVEAVVELVLKE